jgi:hypothetical protein
MKPYNNALALFMERKAESMNRELAIPGEMYFTPEDRDEIMTWDENEAKEIWIKIKENTESHHCAGLRYELCPFCHKNGYKHHDCGVTIKNQSCEVCGYGYRHGMCTDQKSGLSQYRKILKIFENERVDIYRFFTSGFYQQITREIEDTILNTSAK